MHSARVVLTMSLAGLMTATSPSSAQPGAPSKAQRPGAQAGSGAPAQSASARGPGNATSEQARKLYMEGVKAAKKERWADAYAAFLAAWALNKHYTIAGSLGTCELMLGKHRDAAGHLAVNAREIEKDTTATPEERAHAAASYAAARAKVATLLLRVDVDGAEVLADNEVVGTAPLVDPVFLEQGKHTITVRHPAYEKVEVPIEAAAGSQVERVVQLKRPVLQEAPRAAGEAAPSVADTGPGYDKRLVVAGAATAVVGVVAGVVFTVLALDRQSQFEGDSIIPRANTSACTPPVDAGWKDRCVQVDDAVDSYNAFRTGAFVGYSVGAVAAAATLTYWLWPRAKGNQGLSAVPWVSSRVGGMSVGGHF